MPLRIQLKPDGTEGGSLVVHGLPQPWPEVLAAVGRVGEERYLTPHGLWDGAPSWYPCARLDSDPGEDRFAAGQLVTAGILAPDMPPLRVHLRRGEFSESAPLEHSGPVQPPDPLSVPVEPAIPVPAPIGSAPRLAGLAVPAPAAAAPAVVATSEPERPGIAEPSALPHKPRRPRLLGWGALAVVGACAGVLVWSLLPPSSVPPGPPAAGLAPDPPSETLSGKALYLEIASRNPAPDELLAQAERAEGAGDCEAAVRLFIESGRRDGALAERLGQRYDPSGFEPSPCFPQPKPDSAAVWYRQAAERGRVLAQRRYGELLLAESSSGPLYGEGVEWLRRAASAGDLAAIERLLQMGEAR